MAREKATITLDRAKLDRAKSLIRAKSVSATIDAALDRLIRTEQLRHDVSIYVNKPLSEGELTGVELPVEFDLEDEDVDYEATYGKKR